MRKRIDIFTPESILLIFSNIESIWLFQQRFLDSLRKGIETHRIAQVFLNNVNFLLPYFCKKQILTISSCYSAQTS